MDLTQEIVFRWIHESDLPRLYSKLLEVGLANPGSLTMASPIGCSGTTSCNLALNKFSQTSKRNSKKIS